MDNTQKEVLKDGDSILPKVAIVILNWNGRRFLEQFLPKVIEYSQADAEIIIADNASSDDSVAFLQQHYPALRIIQNNQNYGYAQGYNEALNHVEADYYVLLNSDIEVTAGWVKPLVRLMESDTQIAACQPKILSYYDRTHFEYAGAGGGFIDKYGYPFCRGRVFMNIEEDKGQYDDTCEVFWATGAALFVRADLYHRLGGLDDEFFAHMEEIDFCWRLKNEGYKIMYCAESLIYHIGGGTLPKSSARKTFLNFRNNRALLYKNIPKKSLNILFFKRFFLDLLAGTKFLLTGYYQDAWAVVRAMYAFAKWKKSLRIKRRQLKQHEVSMIYKGDIVLDHFLRGKKKFTDLDPQKFSKDNAS